MGHRAKRKRLERLNETESERRLRLDADIRRQKLKRAAESPEQRKLRLARDNERRRIARQIQRQKFKNEVVEKPMKYLKTTKKETVKQRQMRLLQGNFKNEFEQL